MLRGHVAKGSTIFLRGTIIHFPLLINFFFSQFTPRLKRSHAKVSYLQEIKSRGLFCESYKQIRLVFNFGAYLIDTRYSEFPEMVALDRFKIATSEQTHRNGVSLQPSRKSPLRNVHVKFWYLNSYAINPGNLLVGLGEGEGRGKAEVISDMNYSKTCLF